MIVGQLLTVYFAIITVKTSNFSKINIESLSIFIEKPIIYYTFVMFFWNIFTGFLLFSIICPLIIFFRDKLPKYFWTLIVAGQFFLIKDFQYQNFHLSILATIAHLIPAFISLFIANYFQSKRYN